MRKYEEEQRMAKALSGDTPLQLMKTLHSVQQLTHEVSTQRTATAAPPSAPALAPSRVRRPALAPLAPVRVCACVPRRVRQPFLRLSGSNTLAEHTIAQAGVQAAAQQAESDGPPAAGKRPRKR